MLPANVLITKCRLRPVKPCPGVPGIHLNADRTVPMTAALLCGAGASPVHKDRGCFADHDQIEDHAHAQRHAWEMLLWLKNGAHGRRARLARARRRQDVRSCFDVRARFACGLQVGRESLLLCIGNTCELHNWDVHATVLHGDGVEFGAYGPPPRRNVCM